MSCYKLFCLRFAHTQLLGTFCRIQYTIVNLSRTYGLQFTFRKQTKLFLKYDIFCNYSNIKIVSWRNLQQIEHAKRFIQLCSECFIFPPAFQNLKITIYRTTTLSTSQQNPAVIIFSVTHRIQFEISLMALISKLVIRLSFWQAVKKLTLPVNENICKGAEKNIWK